MTQLKTTEEELIKRWDAGGGGVRGKDDRHPVYREDLKGCREIKKGDS